jgi:hypothetical protein
MAHGNGHQDSKATATGELARSQAMPFMCHNQPRRSEQPYLE